MVSLRRLVPFLLAISLAAAGSNPPKDSPGPLQGQDRVTLIRGLMAEHVFIKHVFPMGKKGLELKADGELKPSDADLMQLVADNGPAARPGDRALITDIEFKGNKIIFEINGGGKSKTHWYNHLEVGGMGGWTPVAPANGQAPKGSSVALVFPKYIPNLSVDQVKKLLAPVFDFTAHSAAESYIESLPPKVRDAIKNHQVLVGMNREMVTDALGRADQKIREKDKEGREYEEWIYGHPPSDVQFVRFIGDEVVRLEIMKVGGEKIVRTQPEMQPTQPKVAEVSTQPTKRPSLRRPGEDADQPNMNKTSTIGGPVVAVPDQPPPGTGSPTEEPLPTGPPMQVPNTSPVPNGPPQ